MLLPQELLLSILDIGLPDDFVRTCSRLATTCRGFYSWINFGVEITKVAESYIDQSNGEYSSSTNAVEHTAGRIPIYRATWDKFVPKSLSSTSMKHLRALRTTSVDKFGFSQDFATALVYSCGASTFMGGFAGNDVPSVVIPSLSCRDRTTGQQICGGFSARFLRDQQRVGAVNKCAFLESDTSTSN
jgi:hypothetical protein